jgi:alpha-aminoadipate carrier protein LysW
MKTPDQDRDQKNTVEPEALKLNLKKPAETPALPNETPTAKKPVTETAPEKPTVAECPECGVEIGLEDGTLVGEILQCSDCGVELEVIKLDPPSLELCPEEEEDWGE